MGTDEDTKEGLEKRKLSLEIARLEKLTHLEEKKISAEADGTRHALRRQVALAVIGLVVPALSVSTSIFFHMRSQEQQAESARVQADSDRAALAAKTKGDQMLREREMLIRALSLISNEQNPAERITGAVALSAAVTPGGLEARIASGALLARLSYEQDLQVVEAISRAISNVGVHAAPEIVEANKRAAVHLAKSIADWAEIASRKLSGEERKRFADHPISEINWISTSLSPLLERAGLPVQPDQRGTASNAAELRVLQSKHLWRAYTNRLDALEQPESSVNTKRKDRSQVDQAARLKQIEVELIRSARIVAGTSRAIVQVLRNADTSSLAALDLSNATITRGSLDGKTLSNAKLSGAYVSATVANAKLNGADLTNAVLVGSLAGADLSDAKLAGAYLSTITPFSMRIRARGCLEKPNVRLRFPTLGKIEQETLANAYWQRREDPEDPYFEGGGREPELRQRPSEAEEALEERKKKFLDAIEACTSPETSKLAGTN